MKLGKKPSYVGNFPEKEQEIIVEQAFLDYFGLPQETGQTIRLNLGNGDQDYIISGILQKENNSRMFSVIVSKAFFCLLYTSLSPSSRKSAFGSVFCKNPKALFLLDGDNHSFSSSTTLPSFMRLSLIHS